MSYMVDGGKYYRPRFETLEEACALANEISQRTRIILAVIEDPRPANRERKK